MNLQKYYFLAVDFWSRAHTFIFLFWASRRGLGGNASKRRKRAFTDQRRETSAPSRRAVGLSVTMFFAITSHLAYAIHPCEQHLLYWRIAYALMSKNISTSIPLARPSTTPSRFAANELIPSPYPFFRAANIASGPSHKKNGNIARIRLQT